MSKTLSLKNTVSEVPAPPPPSTGEEPSPPVTVKAFTADELRAMLAAMGEPVATAPRGAVVPYSKEDMESVVESSRPDLSALPPKEDRTDAGVQAPAQVHGKFGLNGVMLLAPGVVPGTPVSTIDPATGYPYIQAGPRPASQISPPPTRNFK